MEVPSRAELKKLKVVELRQKLSAASLPQGGVKDILVTRLLQHYEKIAKEEAGSVAQGRGEEASEQESAEAGTRGDTEAQQEQSTEPEAPPLDQTSASTEEEVTVPPPPPPGEATPEATPPRELAPTQAEAAPPAAPLMEQTAAVSETVPQGEETGQGLPAETMETEVAPSSEQQQEQQQQQTVGQPPVREAELPEAPPEPTTMPPQVPPSSVGEGGAASPEHMDLDPQMPPTTGVKETAPTSPPPPTITPEATPPRVTTPSEETTAPPSIIPEEPRPQTTAPPPSSGTPAEFASFQASMTSDYYSASDSGKEVAEYRGAGHGIPKRGHTLSSSSATAQAPPSNKSTSATSKGEKQQEKGPRQKKKKKRRRRRHDSSAQRLLEQPAPSKETEVEIEYIQQDLLKPGDPHYRHFHTILESFRISEKEEPPTEDQNAASLQAQANQKKTLGVQDADSSDEEEEKEEEKQQMSKKKLRKLNRLTVAQLKQLVERPDVVEMHDVTAMDPKLLIHLKSTRNSVAVPRHWSFKRKYLQGKRGIEKPPFDLPDFIKATGVMEMRQALEDKEDAKSLKQKTRERVRPKMGKLTIDYQKLHDAFFKWQTKPKMTIHGDMYYEGKEFETRLRQKKPGDLSDELRRALGMPTGLGKHKFPPPWLVAMQRYGPPPSYPNLKIPGLNAPIPENCSFGYFVGGWGKPPVDEVGRPLYGDVFGLEQQESGQGVQLDEEVDRTPWGELESEEEEEEEEEEESDEEEIPKPEDIAAGLVTPMEGLVTPSGLTSIPAGLETPDMIQLRKKKIEEAMEQGGETPALYTVIPEKTAAVGGAMMGSSHVYDVTSAAATTSGPSRANAVDVALDPSELDLDTATIAARYDEQVREKRNAIQKEDLSDMVAEHAAKQKKRKRAAADSGGAGGKAAKKLKEFKF